MFPAVAQSFSLCRRFGGFRVPTDGNFGGKLVTLCRVANNLDAVVPCELTPIDTTLVSMSGSGGFEGIGMLGALAEATVRDSFHEHTSSSRTLTSWP